MGYACRLPAVRVLYLRCILVSVTQLLLVSLFFIYCAPLATADPQTTVSRQAAAAIAATQSIVKEVQKGNTGAYPLNDFTDDYFSPSSNKFETHPWYAGRNGAESQMEYLKDSLKILGLSLSTSAIQTMIQALECLEFTHEIPYVCTDYCYPFSDKFDGNFSSCPDKPNHGFVFSFWWPENVVEISDMGISAINPQVLMRPDLLQPYLSAMLDKVLAFEVATHMQLRGDRKMLAPELSAKFSDPNKGKTAWSGMSPQDQTYHQEAHVMRSFLSMDTSNKRDTEKGSYGWIWKRAKYVCIPYKLFWYNGYKKGNKQCWYSTHPEVQLPLNAYTETPALAPYWRFPEKSYHVAYDGKRIIANPSNFTGMDGLGTGVMASISGCYSQFYELSTPMNRLGSVHGMAIDSKYPTMSACSSYRISKWGSRYGQLQGMLGIQPASGELSSGGDGLCMKGGWDLFPVVGSLVGHHNEVANAAILTRRALHLTGRDKVWNPKFRRTSRFSDDIDKLQRISPDVSKCFSAKDIDPYNQSLFPPNIVSSPQQTIRYVHWNKRVACVCQYRGIYPLYSMIGSAVESLPIGQGCSNYDGGILGRAGGGVDSEKEGKGDEDCQEPTKGAWAPPAMAAPFDPAFEAAFQLYPWISGDTGIGGGIGGGMIGGL